MTDREFLLHVLADGEPHTLNEILRSSFAMRGCGLTVHSRAADLRRDGYRIFNERVDGAARGDASTYRLLEESAETAPPQARPLADSSSGPTSIPSGRSEPSALTSGVLLPRDRGVASEGPLPSQLVLEVPVTSREREAA